MRKWMRHFVSVMTAAALVCAGLPSTVRAVSLDETNETETAAVQEGIQQPFEILTGDELREDMGAGWNLGNTMDGHSGFTPGETVWQHVTTTKKLIKSVHDMGFNTVRIPVTWGTMIDDENDFAIDKKWIARVQDIVDYCISQDMYVIVNIHHDGAEQMGWLRIASDDQEGLEKKFAGVWKNIATVFRDYDEHLIFESMNEVKGENMTVVQENNVIMKLNQIFVDTVRATGSNNEQRWLMMPGKYNYIDSVCNTKNNFSLPKDSVENRLIVSVHFYSPWEFCGLENSGSDRYDAYNLKGFESNEREIKPLYDTYTSKGIQVVVGEYGCINKDNPEERAFYLEGVNRIFRKYKCIGVYWDQGWYDRSRQPDYSFSIVDRETGKSIDKTVTDGLFRGFFSLDGQTDYSNLTKNPEVKPVTELTASVTEVTLESGATAAVTMDYLPADSNDVILWKTSDPDVATVAYGKIHGKMVGTAVVTAYTQNGEASVDIPVTVTAKEDAAPCTGITLQQESETLTEGDSVWLQPQLTPEETGEAVYFHSDNEDVATVSSVGKLLAVGAGEAKITAATSGGQSTEMTVTVEEKVQKKELQLAVNVYYNDGVHDYYANEVSGDVQTITGDGQYTLTFDCDTDLSEDAKKKGVDTLNRVTAIYIKDYQVTQGELSTSVVKRCNIRYDAIDVDGKALTIKTTEAKSAIKDSGIFDTNDPINAWDGSAVEEVSNNNNVASFRGIENPKKISITFTLSEMSFEEGPQESSKPTQPVNTPAASQEPVPVPTADNTQNPADPSVQPTQPAGTTASQAPQTASTATPPAVASPDVQSTDRFESGDGSYELRDDGKSVTFVGVTSDKATVKIPAKVTRDGVSYQVTVIGKKAFAGNQKIKSVVIGKNVTQIGAKAFYQCKKLKKITVQTKKLKKIGNQAVQGISPKAVIQVPKAKKKAYQKLWKAKTGYKKTMKLRAA